jgi:hypothetical protein
VKGIKQQVRGNTGEREMSDEEPKTMDDRRRIMAEGSRQ